MKHRKVIPIVLLLAAVVAAAAPPSPPGEAIAITGPATARPHQLVRLSAVGVPDGAAVLWTVTPEDVADLDEQGSKLVFVGPPGVYRVKALAISSKDGKTAVTVARATVTIEGPTPVPTPIPVVPKTPSADAGKASPERALVQISRPTGPRTAALCTATVIGPRRADGRWDILTASHCLASATDVTVETQSGKTFKARKVSQDARADICWLVTDGPVEGLAFATLAKETPPEGTLVWHAGYGVDKPRNREDGYARKLQSDGKLEMVLSVSHGDSGGGIFRQDNGELVANVCCTSGLGARTRMFGGGCVRAWELRPKP